MKILVTNDDGFDNPGIWALVRAVNSLGEVTVVAPADNQSGVGTALSLRKSVKIKQTASQVDGVDCYAVSGTPADSVILGLEHVLQGGADIVLSGINPGFNTSRNVFISGTMGAAIQASGKGVKACAFSLGMDGDLEDAKMGDVANAIAVELLSSYTPRGSLFNINFPAESGDTYKGVEGAFPQPTEFMTKLETHRDGGYEIFSGLRINILQEELIPGSDIEVLNRGCIAISALDGPTLAHNSEDSTLQRMVEAAKRVIG